MSRSSPGRREPAKGRRVLRRKAFFVDEAILKRAKRALGVRTDSDVVRLSMELVAEMEELWRLLRRTKGVLGPADFDAP